MLDCIDKVGDKSEDEGLIESEDQFDNDQSFSHDRKGAKITSDDVVATALVVLVAGYDTTAITLSYLPVGMNTRTCTQDYRIPSTTITVREGDLLTFSVAAFHQDPEHFFHPDDFYPEHFIKEEKAARSP